MNSSYIKLPFAGALAIMALFFSACATQIRTSVTSNPPPAEAFSNFTAFEMKPAVLAPAYADNATNQKALAKIQENLSAGMDPALNSWNQAGATKGGAKRTLMIEPVVAEIKFIGGAARFWAGAMAGSSAVIARATITEKETGKVIATPEFYAVAGAWGGGWTIGGTDNMMLSRIAQQLTNYLVTNYASAVGGPTGATTR
jgi:hypothetical protein